MTTLRGYYSIVGAAGKCGIPTSTLHNAVDRGDVACTHTACGRIKLVRLPDVRRFMRGEHPGGRYGRRAAWRNS